MASAHKQCDRDLNWNFYKTVMRGAKPKAKYPNYDRVQIDLPFRALLLGPSGSGKTNLALVLIKAIGTFDKIVLLAKNLDQPLYKHLIERCRKWERDNDERMLLATSELSDLPALQDYDKRDNTLVIVDDFICCTPKELKPIEELWIRGRHQNISMAFLSQSYFATPKKIRQNSNVIMIKRLLNAPDLKRILREYALSTPLDDAMQMYERAIHCGPGGDPLQHWFTIMPESPDQDLVFRANFKPFHTPAAASTAPRARKSRQ